MAYFYKERTLMLLITAAILLAGWLCASASLTAANAANHGAENNGDNAAYVVVNE